MMTSCSKLARAAVALVTLALPFNVAFANESSGDTTEMRQGAQQAKQRIAKRILAKKILAKKIAAKKALAKKIIAKKIVAKKIVAKKALGKQVVQGRQAQLGGQDQMQQRQLAKAVAKRLQQTKALIVRVQKDQDGKEIPKQLLIKLHLKQGQQVDQESDMETLFDSEETVDASDVPLIEDEDGDEETIELWRWGFRGFGFGRPGFGYGFGRARPFFYSPYFYQPYYAPIAYTYPYYNYYYYPGCYSGC